MKKVFVRSIFLLLISFATKLHAQTYNVGAGGTYTTLEEAVTAYNSMVLTQPVVFLLTDAVYSPAASISIQKNTSANSIKTLTIKPAPGVTASISAAVSNDALLKITGDYIIIDGSNNGTNTRNLSIINTATVAPRVINIGGAALASAVSNIAIRNTIITNGNEANMALTLSAPTSTSTGGYFNTITIENNSIRKSLYGINVVGATGAFQNGSAVKLAGNDLASTGTDAIRNIGIFIAGLTNGCTVTDNIIGNFETATLETDKGISISTACSTVLVKNNSISGLVFSGTSNFAPMGIDIGGTNGTNITVDGNQVSGITATGTTEPRGISLVSTSTNVTIQNNRVSNIKNTRANTAAYGVYFEGSSASGVYKLINNFIWDIAGTTQSYGIIMAAAQGNRLIAHNTVLLSVTAGNSYALFAGNGISTTRTDCRNNLFINRSTPAGTSYGIYKNATATIFTAIDYNNVEGTPLGSINGTSLATIDNFKTYFGTHSLNIPPVFVAANDLHLATAGNASLDNNGMPITGIITDIDGSARSGTAPDIGAHEFGSISNAALIINCTTEARAFCPGSSFDLGYTVQGTPDAGNVFTAQLSNAAGSFTTPITIGTLASVATSGTISVNIPTTAQGSFYRIRIVSSAPAYTGTDNGTDLFIQKPFTGSITGVTAAVAGTAYPFSVTLNSNSTYQWAFNTGIQNTGGNTNSVTGTFTSSGLQQVSVTEINQAGCSGAAVIKSVLVTPIITHTWTGDADTDWHNPANWSGNFLPTTTSDVSIPAGRPRYPVISINTAVKSISAATGTTVDIATGVNLIINGE